MISFEKNLYWVEEHQLNVDKLESSCRSVVNYAKTNLMGIAEVSDASNVSKHHPYSLIGDIYNGYNLLLYPLPELHQLYNCIRTSFRHIETEGNWWFKCWVNVYSNSAHYDWHQHNESYVDTDTQHNSYHGFYCVAGDNTVTTYRNLAENTTVHIPQTPNQLTLIANHPDWYHRTWPYKGDRDRVSVAFNILHEDNINAFQYPNHWIPL